MNTPSVILKSTILATCIFWIILISENFQNDMIPFVFLSIIPISICCTVTILFTIMPFFLLKKDGSSNKSVFKKYFPFYAIVSFSLCCYGVIELTFAISFFISAFFTTMQSWIWLAKDNQQRNN
ncbi:hypothetical protein [Flavivirga spongiicola]|uniref:Uncharacterized protein n=1 Tax=Flavivirga spongiicola TaxID=421621 RepID=A0ABU7XWF9_9FLAO|nr:hypothetical protein [Flavivirga sp. MEBiC05379]MDO5980097.1 hypothetical protein [Flavivirga sp. MEBiC05379]